MRILGWLKSWFPCHLDWMDDHDWDHCWTCFYRSMRRKKKLKAQFPQARVLRR